MVAARLLHRPRRRICALRAGARVPFCARGRPLQHLCLVPPRRIPGAYYYLYSSHPIQCTVRRGYVRVSRRTWCVLLSLLPMNSHTRSVALIVKADIPISDPEPWLLLCPGPGWLCPHLVVFEFQSHPDPVYGMSSDLCDALFSVCARAKGSEA